MIIYAKSSPLHRRFSRRRRKGTDFKAPTLMFLVARRSVGGRTDERGRGGERERGTPLSLLPSLPTQLAKLLFVPPPPSGAKRTAAALPFDAASPRQLPAAATAAPPMMLRAEKTDEHKLPHFIDNQPRSTAARTKERGGGGRSARPRGRLGSR